MEASQIAPLPDDIPDDLRQVIMESLRAPDSCAPQLAWTMQDALDPGDEPVPTAREFADIVAPFIKPTMSEHEQTADYQPPAGWRSRRTIAGFAAALACLLISATGLRFWLDSRPSDNGTAPTQTATESRSDAPSAHEDIASDPAPEPAREPTEQHVIGIRQLSASDAEPSSPQPPRATRQASPARKRATTAESPRKDRTAVRVSRFSVLTGDPLTYP